MSTIKMQQAYLSELQNSVCRAAEHSSSAANTVSKAMNGLSGMQFSSKESTIAELSSLKQRLNLLCQNGNAYAKLIEEYSDSMQEIDDNTNDASDTIIGRISAWTEGTAKSLFSFSLSTQLGKQAATAGLFLGGAGLLSGITKIFKEFWDMVKGWFGNPVKEEPFKEELTYKVDLPDYVYDYTKIDYINPSEENLNSFRRYVAENGGSGSVEIFNQGGEVACTYYTLKKLRERGLGFPFAYAGSTNGDQWYNNCSNSVPKKEGADSVQAILEQYGGKNEAVENVVLVCNGNHVMLLDKIFKDTQTGKTMVTFSDNTVWGENKEYVGALLDPYTDSPARTWTLEEFITKYSKYPWSGIKGSILIGRGS